MRSMKIGNSMFTERILDEHETSPEVCGNDHNIRPNAMCSLHPCTGQKETH